MLDTKEQPVDELIEHNFCNWPIILAGRGSGMDEFIEDGYNRVCNYLLKKKKLIPAVWFPDRESDFGR
jgi:hypothetical protein